MKKMIVLTLLLATCAMAADYNETFKALKFREIGPAVMGGRIDDFAVVESNPDIIFVGTASGGVFKTTNGGTTWQAVFDDQPVSSIGDVTVAPSDPSIVWAGSGESNNRQSSSWGNGVYKSTDGGKTWKHLGLDATRHIGRIVISPADPNTVYVAAAGSLWGPSKDRGVYKTTNGGETWNKVLFVNEDTGVNDIAMDPESPGTLIAAAYQRRRTVFGFNGGGPGSGLYKSTDGGATWKKLEKGLPWDPAKEEGPTGESDLRGEERRDERRDERRADSQSAPREGGPTRESDLRQSDLRQSAPDSQPAPKDIGRIGVDFFRRNGNVVYAIIQHAAGGVFRSDDKGETWTKMSDTNPRGSYYSNIRIDPNNDQRIWVLGAQMYVSEDGGKTFKTNVVQRIHGDFHAMWIDPRDSDHMITGSDGGIYLSRDRGRSWDFVNTIPLGQFYEIGLDMSKPYRICGGLQDNNAWCGPSATMEPRGIANSDWYTVGGGDGFYAQWDPVDPNIVYAESQDGNLLRRNLKTHESRSIRPPAPEGERYRFQWNSPLVVSAFDTRTIYYGGNYLFKSTDRGDSWTRLGNDLTTGQDRDKMPIMGRVADRSMISLNDGVQAWPAITTISESPKNADLLWAGTDDGNLQVTRDGGKTWKNVADKVKGLPKGTYVSRVVASRFAEGTAYAAFDGHRSDDFNAYLYMTTDFGETWKPIKSGLPTDADIVHVIREHYRNPKLLFAGTEHGLYISPDQGGHWTRLELNLPTVPVDDIAIHPRENDLVLATHGRSIWILDDLTPFEQWADSIASEDLHLFDMRPATAFRLANRSGSTGQQIFLGPNPPAGALITYFLKTKPAAKEKVKVTITDKAGKVLREIDGTKGVGVNRVNWDLRTRSVLEAPREEGESAEAAPQAGGGGGGFGFSGAMRVEPGEYTVKVTAGKSEQSKTLVVEEDPRIVMTAEERAARRQALTQLGELASRAVAARRSMTGMRSALNTALEGWKKTGAAKPPENVLKTAEDLLKRVDETCRKFGTAVQCGEKAASLGNAGPPLVYTPPTITQRITQLLGGIEGYAAAPTAWQLDQVKLLDGMLKTAGAEARKLAQDELGALNKMMNDANVPHLVIPRREPATATTPGD
ncbi:MAG TPA: hypothetical protein VLV78_06990 [Thermoanaerobaculia bacterium]|nr:hypothetical protein [Thermoanaerobaculia bacterium]